MSKASATVLVNYATTTIKTDSRLCNLGVISRRPAASPSARFHVHTREPPSVPPGTQWTSKPPDDSSWPREHRTDSLDERTQMNVTTAERKGIFRGNAPSPRNYDSHGKSHTEPWKPHLKKKQRKNHQGTTALGRRP